MKKLLASAFAFCVLASGAMAADEITQPWYWPDYDWSGWYVGVHGGHVSGETENNTAFLPNGSADNLFGGVHGGYRHQMGDWVGGINLAVPLIAEETNYVLPGFGFLNEVRNKATVLGSVQLGRSLGRIMPFMSAGLGVAWMEGRETIGGVTSPWAEATHLVGTLGGGVNVAIDEYWTTGAIYYHFWTSEEEYDCGPVICAVVGDFSMEGDVFAVFIERRL